MTRLGANMSPLPINALVFSDISRYDVLQSGERCAMLCRISSNSLVGLTCLPLNAYSIVQSKEHGAWLVEAGVLQENGTLLVAQQCFHNGHCSHMSIGAQTTDP